MNIQKIFENPADLFQILQILVSFLAGIGALWWRISKSYHTIKLQLYALDASINSLKKSSDLVNSQLIRLSTRFDEREKDTLRLEGAIDAQRKDMVNVIATLQQSNGSLEAVWRTLQRLFPEHVPKRASDRV